MPLQHSPTQFKNGLSAREDGTLYELSFPLASDFSTATPVILVFLFPRSWIPQAELVPPSIDTRRTRELFAFTQVDAWPDERVLLLGCACHLSLPPLSAVASRPLFSTGNLSLSQVFWFFASLAFNLSAQTVRTLAENKCYVDSCFDAFFSGNSWTLYGKFSKWFLILIKLAIPTENKSLLDMDLFTKKISFQQTASSKCVPNPKKSYHFSSWISTFQ